MQISAAPLIYILIFVAVVVLVEGLYLTVFGKSISLNNRMSRRLALLEKNQNREQVLEQLRKEMSQHLNSKGIPLYSILANKAQKANIAFSPRQLIMLMGALSVVAYLGLTIGTEAGTPVRILVGIAMGVGGIYTWVNPLVGWLAILSVFAATVLGGMTSFPGTILGAYLVAFSENTLMQFLNAWLGLDFSLKPAIPFVIIILVLLVRPQGFTTKKT